MTKTILAQLLNLHNGTRQESKENIGYYRVYLGGVKPRRDYSGNRMEPHEFNKELFAILREALTTPGTKEDREKTIHEVMSLLNHEIRAEEETREASEVQMSARENGGTADNGWVAEHGS
jgi:hypothetical protein